MNNERRPHGLNDRFLFLREEGRRFGFLNVLESSLQRRRDLRLGGGRLFLGKLEGQGFPLWQRRFFFLLFPHLSQEADLRPSFGKFQHVSILKQDFLDRLAVDKRTVGAVIIQFELVSLPNDIRMFPGDNGEVGGEANVTIGMASNGDQRVGKILDLPLERAQNVNELDDNDRGAFHGFRVKL